MSNYVLTVIFNHKYVQGITSQVYSLETREQAIAIISSLQEDIGIACNVRASIACIGELGENHVSKNS